MKWTICVVAICLLWVFVLMHIFPHKRRLPRSAFEERGCYMVVPEVGLARCTR